MDRGTIMIANRQRLLDGNSQWVRAMAGAKVEQIDHL
jgi:hypothetical protein